MNVKTSHTKHYKPLVKHDEFQFTNLEECCHHESVETLKHPTLIRTNKLSWDFIQKDEGLS